MKISLNHQKLSKALSYTSKAVSVKPNIPILSNILLDVDKDTVRLSATNLDMGITMWIPGKVEASGKTTVNGKYIADFAAATSGENISLDLKGTNLTVTAENSDASFTTIEADEFPVLPVVKGNPLFRVATEDFISSMDKVLFACSTDLAAGRMQQSGVLFDIDKEKKGEITFVGLDGFRLSKVITEISDLNTEFSKEEIIVPARLLGDFVKIASDYDADTIDVYLSESNSQIIFRIQELEFSIRLLEGPYPDYKKILPDSSSFSFEVNKVELESAIKIVNTFARGNLGNKTLFDFDIERSKVVLTSTVAEIGEGKTEFFVNNVSGESDLNSAYTLRYLQDVVNHLKSQTVIFETKGPLAASVFKDKSDNKFLHLIMPMRRDV